MPEKNPNHLRIGVQNFRGFCLDPDDFGETSLWQWIKTEQFDVFGVPETNVNWDKMNGKERFNERFKERFEKGTIKAVKAHNSHANKLRSRYLHGGVAQFSLNQAAFRLIKNGFDPTKMGRYCWQLLQGKGGKRASESP